MGHLISIEAALALNVTGIINNTHLMNDTSLEDIIKGEEIAEKLSKEKNIEVVCSCVNDNLIKQNIKTKYQLFNIEYDIKNIGSVV